MKKQGRFCQSILILISMVLSEGVFAQTPAECGPTDRVENHRLLRQLYLDLYGRIPTIEEYERLANIDHINAATVAPLLQSEEYFAMVREYHRSLLWGSLDGIESVSGVYRELEYDSSTDTYHVPGLSISYRGLGVDWPPESGVFWTMI